MRGERARSDRWIYERKISNTLSNLMLDSTSTTLRYKTARIRSPARHMYVRSFLEMPRNESKNMSPNVERGQQWFLKSDLIGLEA